jgi:site-specific recombinase XerC
LLLKRFRTQIVYASAFVTQHSTAAEVMYGGGLRLTEMLRLRVKDVDLGDARSR